MLLVKKFGLLGAFHTAFLCLLWAIAAGALPASAQTSPGIPVPVGTWTNVLTQGLPVSTNDWEQLVYAHSIQQSVMLSQYHQVNSEPNESIIGYNFDTNSWDVLDMGGLFHTENMPEGGESQGYFDYNANDATIDYHCCTSGSNQAENVNHTWWYDLLGQAGRDKQTPNEPTSLQPGGAFDVTDDVSVMYGGDSYVGTWTYDPVGNAWSPINTFGLAPDPSVILPGAAYDSTTDQVFIYGGKNSAGTTFYSSLYAYSVPTNTWTPISPSNGAAPPARCCMNFAYDPNDNIFLLYGGKNASGVLGDTWAFNPVTNTWTQLFPPVSPAIDTVSDFTRLAYDSDHNAFVLAHLGSNGYFGGSWSTLPFQTWLFRYAGAGPNAGTILPSVQPPAGSLNRYMGGWGKDPAIASSGASLYTIWAETSSPFDTTGAAWPHIYTDQYANANWQQLGATYQSISAGETEAHMPSITVANGMPWISWTQNVSRVPQIYAASWNGSTWVSNTAIGLVGSDAVQGRSQIAAINGSPYIGFIEVNKSVSPQSAYAYVRDWNGSSWPLLGSGALNRASASGTTATSISIASDGTYPYVAWTEYVRSSSGPGGGGLASTNPQVYVSHWNGTQWAAVGGSLNFSTSAGWANDASVVYFSGQPYVAWTERTQSGNNQLYVSTWNGTSWNITGAGSLNQGGTNGWAFHPCLITDSGGANLYVAWVEQTALGQKAQVFVAQYVNEAWVTLGGALNANLTLGSAARVSLTVVNGQPAAAWSEVELGAVRQIYVAQWNGSTWNLLPASTLVDTTAPSTPTSLVAKAVSSGQINLGWAKSTDKVGVIGYYVYRNGAQVGNVTTTYSYQDTGLTPSTTYSYNVAAYDAAGNISKQSTTVKATTLAGGGTPPTVSITAPTNGATVSGSVSISATATDNAGMSQVQFQLDGANLGAPVSGSGPVYTMSWNSTTASNGPHTVSAIATDILNLTSSASVSVTVNNSSSPLVISSVAAGSITSSGATITWTTNEPATSQVAYGLTNSYGSLTTLNGNLQTSQSVTITGLSPSTTYHYQALSQDSNGNQASSADATFLTAPAGEQTYLQILGNQSEVTGTQQGSIVTPAVGPTGFTGSVVVNGKGSVNFSPVQSGDGVYFLNCCANSNNAYYQFTGSTLGSIFNSSEGQISFTLQSSYSFAQREATAAASRYAFDVRDGNGTHYFSFLTEVVSGRLEFNYMVGGKTLVYYVPQGTEDRLYGLGVDLQVTINWGASGVTLYFNNNLVQSSTFTSFNPNWTAASNFDLGAFQYQSFGGYNVSDDIVSNFTVAH